MPAGMKISKVPGPSACSPLLGATPAAGNRNRRGPLALALAAPSCHLTPQNATTRYHCNGDGPESAVDGPFLLSMYQNIPRPSVHHSFLGTPWPEQRHASPWRTGHDGSTRRLHSVPTKYLTLYKHTKPCLSRTSYVSICRK